MRPLAGTAVPNGPMKSLAVEAPGMANGPMRSLAGTAVPNGPMKSLAI